MQTKTSAVKLTKPRLLTRAAMRELAPGLTPPCGEEFSLTVKECAYLLGQNRGFLNGSGTELERAFENRAAACRKAFQKKLPSVDSPVTIDELRERFAIAKEFLSSVCGILLADPKKAYLANGFERLGDKVIIENLIHMLVQKDGKSPLRLLEIGAGTSDQQDENASNKDHYGHPWLMRAIALAFGDLVECHISDLKFGLKQSLEEGLFGIQSVHNQVNFLYLSNKLEGKFDLVVASHLDPISGSAHSYIAQSVLRVLPPDELTSEARGLIFSDTVLGQGIGFLFISANKCVYYNPGSWELEE